MANVLPMEKKISVISALTEGVSIRAINRMTGIHQKTIMDLGMKVGQGCAKLMDENMRDLDSTDIQMDEIWGFVGKKNKNASEAERAQGLGDVWTFVAIDSKSKAVPCFRVGKRDVETTHAFVSDVAKRLKNRVQISTDSMYTYKRAMEASFGSNVDYGQIVKSYGTDNSKGKYSPATLISVEKERMIGFPDPSLISTSYVERQNLTMRMHIRRLTRLTNAFSKKLDSFKAAVALHFGYYNFVKVHATLKATPAMAAGVTRNVWGLSDLIERAA